MSDINIPPFPPLSPAAAWPPGVPVPASISSPRPATIPVLTPELILNPPGNVSGTGSKFENPEYVQFRYRASDLGSLPVDFLQIRTFPDQSLITDYDPFSKEFQDSINWDSLGPAPISGGRRVPTKGDSGCINPCFRTVPALDISVVLENELVGVRNWSQKSTVRFLSEIRDDCSKLFKREGMSMKQISVDLLCSNTSEQNNSYDRLRNSLIWLGQSGSHVRGSSPEKFKNFSINTPDPDSLKSVHMRLVNVFDLFPGQITCLSYLCTLKGYPETSIIQHVWLNAALIGAGQNLDHVTAPVYVHRGLPYLQLKLVLARYGMELLPTGVPIVKVKVGSEMLQHKALPVSLRSLAQYSVAGGMGYGLSLGDLRYNLRPDVMYSGSEPIWHLPRVSNQQTRLRVRPELVNLIATCEQAALLAKWEEEAFRDRSGNRTDTSKRQVILWLMNYKELDKEFESVLETAVKTESQKALIADKVQELGQESVTKVLGLDSGVEQFISRPSFFDKLGIAA